MKKLLIGILLFSSQVSLGLNLPPISECYSYHTPHYFDVFVKNSKVVFQHTIKDPNGISYVSRKQIVLESIKADDFLIVSEDQNNILFSNIDGYYIVEKDSYQLSPDQGAFKIGDHNNVSQTIGTNFICKKGSWFYMTPLRYDKKILEREIKNMPKNIEFLAADALREGTIYKNENRVFVFNEETLTFRTIEHLTGSEVKFERVDAYFKRNFLYDNDTFYFLDFNHMIDYTDQFTSSDKFTSLKNAEVIYVGSETTINTNDGIIWLFLKFTKEDENGISKKIIPLEATYIGKEKNLILYNGKVCNNFHDIIFDKPSINIDAIINIEELVADEYFYSDQESKYLYDYDKKSFKPITWLPAKAQLYPSNGTYGYLGNSPFYADENLIYFIKDPKEKYITLTHTSNIKDLKLAYAYDDKLLIENKEIDNIADRETMSFLGSTVNVIEGCDGGRGQHPVIIDVYYFFKDKNYVYYYNTSGKQMKKLLSQKVKNAKSDDYDYLSKLVSYQ